MILEYKLILIPLIILVIVQTIKIIIDLSKGNFSWNVFLNYGGMPSGHTALVISTATIIGIYTNWNSPVFLLSAILALLVIRDAIGFRMQLSEHAKILNKLIKELPDDKEYKYPYSPERIGHTFSQVITGGLIGLILTFILYWWI